MIYYVYPKILPWKDSLSLESNLPFRISLNGDRPDDSAGFLMVFETMEAFNKFDAGEGLNPVIVYPIKQPDEVQPSKAMPGLPVSK
jgi:hypothetical protein